MAKKNKNKAGERNPMYDKLYEMKKSGDSWEKIFAYVLDNYPKVACTTVKEKGALRSGVYYRAREEKKKGGGAGDGGVKLFGELLDRDKSAVLTKYNEVKRIQGYTPTSMYEYIVNAFPNVIFPDSKNVSRMANHFHKTGNVDGGCGCACDAIKSGASSAMRLITPSGVTMTFEGPKEEIAKIITSLL